MHRRCLFGSVLSLQRVSWALETNQFQRWSLAQKFSSTPSMRTTKPAPIPSQQDSRVTLTMGEKVKENAKTSVYGGVLLAGLAVTGALAYTLLSELFSPDSPNNIYSDAFERCKKENSVLDALGAPVKAYGEEGRRGWRRHVAHTEFNEGGIRRLRMRFYVKGTFRKGTVHLQKASKNGKYEYEYLIVEADGYPSKTISINTN